jgi:hypothetical protein
MFKYHIYQNSWYDELGKAMMVIAKNNYGIAPEDLFVTTAREFG